MSFKWPMDSGIKPATPSTPSVPTPPTPPAPPVGGPTPPVTPQVDLTPDDYYTEWKTDPNPDTLTPLMESLQPTIDKSMKTYGFENDETIRNSAQLHVIKSLDRYDPDKGAKVETYVTNELRRTPRIGMQQRNVMPIPEQAALDLRDLESAEIELHYKLGREPTTAELADYTGLSVKRIETIRKKYGTPWVSEGSLTGDQGEVQTQGVAEMDRDQLWMELVYDDLDPTDKKIMDWTLGWHGEEQLDKVEIANRLGISVSAVSQRSAKIAGKLQEAEDYNVI